MQKDHPGCEFGAMWQANRRRNAIKQLIDFPVLHKAPDFARLLTTQQLSKNRDVAW
jgi:hypothetical protein